MLSCELTETKHTREVYFQHRGPIDVRVFDSGRATNDAGVVDENVQTSKTIECLVDEIARSLRLSEIAGNTMRDAGRLSNHFASCLRRMAVAVTRDLRAGFGKGDGDSRTQTG